MFRRLLNSMGYVHESEIFVEVTNKIRYRSANKKYYKVTANGKLYLFTDSNLRVARLRARMNPEDLI